MSREIVIVARNTGGARVSLMVEGSRVGMKTQKFEPSFNSGYLNALELVTITLEQALEHGIGDITIFTLSNVTNAIRRYYKTKSAVKLLKLDDEEEEMQKVFELFVEGKSGEMSEEEQELWSRFIPAEYECSEAGLIKTIRNAYSGEYLEKMEADIAELEEEAKEKGIRPRYGQRERFKKRITLAHRKAWELVPEASHAEEYFEIEDVF